MKVKFWGVRGGIPTPEFDKMRYGGNTSCVTVTADSGEMLILDAGTGIRMLGNEMEHRLLQQATILLSHLHWDHIQGIPFFKPLFNPENQIQFVGASRDNCSLEESLEKQQRGRFFPVEMKHMAAEKHFQEVSEETFGIGPFTITSRELNHPGGCLGFRIEVDGRVFTYTTDTEHRESELDPHVLELADHADYFCYDCNYTPEEYINGHQGWGHSTWKVGTRLAEEAQAKTLIIFHHDQTHNDDQMDAILQQARRLFPNTEAASEILEL